MEERGWLTRNLTVGKLNALVKKIGLENVGPILSNKKSVLVEDGPFEFFDKHGLRIAWNEGPLYEGRVCAPDRDFYFRQPELKTQNDYAERLDRVQEHFPDANMSVTKFRSGANKLLKQLDRHERVRNLLRGAYLPLCIPSLRDISDGFDYGRVLQEKFVPALERAFKAQFPKHEFFPPHHHIANQTLTGKISIICASRHHQLVGRMMEGPVVGIYFPTTLQGFSVMAQRDQIRALPGGLLLNGGFDTVTAEVIYPDVLVRDSSPGLHLSALYFGGKEEQFFGLTVDGEQIFFSITYGGIEHAYGHCSGGLLFIGFN